MDTTGIELHSAQTVVINSSCVTIAQPTSDTTPYPSTLQVIEVIRHAVHSTVQPPPSVVMSQKRVL